MNGQWWYTGFPTLGVLPGLFTMNIYSAKVQLEMTYMNELPVNGDVIALYGTKDHTEIYLPVQGWARDAIGERMRALVPSPEGFLVFCNQLPNFLRVGSSSRDLRIGER